MKILTIIAILVCITLLIGASIPMHDDKKQCEKNPNNKHCTPKPICEHPDINGICDDPSEGGNL